MDGPRRTAISDDGEREEIGGLRVKPALIKPGEFRDLVERDVVSLIPRVGSHAVWAQPGAVRPRDCYKVRKFFNSILPSSVRIDSGWNCTPWLGYSRWRRPMISFSAVSALISSCAGKVSRFTSREW